MSDDVRNDVRNELRAAWRHYDDDALAALASIGLLRRAARDVEAGKVGWDADDGAARGVIEADGQRVQLAPQGPGAARCDCPAPGVCKHILAAALWLRDDTVAGTQDAIAAAPDVLAEVLALDPAALCRAAGLAATRKAAALYATLDGATAEVQGEVLVIALPGIEPACRYVAGAGFGGMVSDAPPQARNSTHLLALALAWRIHGRTFPWPEGVSPPAVPEPALRLGADERRFLHEARALVFELCAGGWSHLGASAAPRLRALSTSARVDAFPRLAGLLRALAGSAALLVRRDFGADERQALRLAAQIHALVSALERCDADPVALARLRGSVQRSFAPGATLHLLALGACWWQRRSGARGLSVAFWEPRAGAILQAVLARRDRSDPAFHRGAAWSDGALWQGVGAPGTLAGHGLVLAQPRLAADGRLALGGASHATLEPGWRADDERWMHAGVDDWDALRAALADGAGLLGAPRDLMLLRPASWEPPQFDEGRQELRWRVRDRHHARLLLRMPYTAWKGARLEYLQGWCAALDAIAAIVVRVERGNDGEAGAGPLLEPVMLLVERKGRLHPLSLDFDAAPAAPSPSDTPAPALPPMATRPAHERLLDAMLAQLERKAMSGHLHLAGPGDALHGLHAPLLALGLDTVAGLLARYLARPGCDTALALVHVGQLALELDGGFLRE